MKGLFVYFAFFAANLFIFVAESTHAVDDLRVASASLTSPSILYLQIAAFVDGMQLIWRADINDELAAFLNHFPAEILILNADQQ